ncbi:TetR/AcrR family transcriptional regulator [Spirillospora sp. NPDC049652]
MSGDSARERIIEVATGLFAELGYDGTSTRLIAEATGLNIATVAYHVGNKRDLYLAVMERAHQKERAALEEVTARLAPDLDSVLRLLDHYIDFCAANPEIPALWVHRWQSDAADVAHLENAYVQPLIEMVGEAIGKVAGDDIDLEYVVWSVIWCTHGFARGGVLRDDGQRHRMDDPSALIRFRAHMRRMVTMTLGLSP